MGIARSYRNRLISSCVACWHAFDYDSANTRYRNIGRSRGGSTLYLNEDATAANRPKRVVGSGFVYFPGASGNGIIAPDAAELSITGDLDIRILIAPDDWTPASAQILVAKETDNTTRSYSLYLNPAGTLMGLVSSNGSATATMTSTAAIPGVDGSALWVRWTYDADNGASGKTSRFYYSSDGQNWTQIGSDVTSATAINPFDSTASLEIGASHVSTTDSFGVSFAGKVYQMQLRSGINGTVVASFDGALCGQTGYTDTTTTPNVAWSLNRGGVVKLKLVVMANTAAACFMGDGSNDYLSCSDNDLLDIADATPATWFSLARLHGTPGNGIYYLLAKKTATDANAGWALRVGTSSQTPTVKIADGSDHATATGGNLTDHNLSLFAALLDTSNVAAVIDGTAGSNATRSAVNSLANSVDLQVLRSAAPGDYLTAEVVGCGLILRKLTTAELARLKWELQSYGKRFFFDLITVLGSSGPSFSLFSWPAGVAQTGTYAIASGIVSANVSAPSGGAPSEADLPSNRYRHHTRIAYHGGVIFVAYSVGGTDEDAPGQQVALCYSSDEGATWSAPVLVVPAQSTWSATGSLTEGSRFATPRNFSIISGTLYLVCAIDTVTNGDRIGSALVARSVATNGTLGILSRISSLTYNAIDGKDAIAYDSGMDSLLMAQSLLYGTWGGSQPRATQVPWSGFSDAWGMTFAEPVTFPADGTGTKFHRLWRNIASTHVWQAYSSDSGATFSAPYETDIPNSPSETYGLRLTDGRFAIIGNPVNVSVSRDPLFLAITDVDSVNVTDVYAIRQGLSDTPTYTGAGKHGGASYVSAIEVDVAGTPYLYIAYSLQKETIGFSKLPIPN